MTYALGISGVNADNDSGLQNLIVSDPQAVPGGQALTMEQGAQFLCKGPDGSQAYYQIDASRSIPGQPPVLIAVGP